MNRRELIASMLAVVGLGKFVKPPTLVPNPKVFVKINPLLRPGFAKDWRLAQLYGMKAERFTEVINAEIKDQLK